MGSSRLARGTAALAFIAAVSAASQARASDPSEADRERARDLMDEGYELKEKGDHPAALQRFTDADALMHVPTTTIAVGLEQLAMGNLVEAEATLLAIVGSPLQPREPEPFTKARVLAQKTLAELEPRIPALNIAVVGSSEEAVVDVDGVVLAESVRARPVKVNPGHHVVAAVAGTARARLEIDVAEGEAKPVSLTLIAPASLTEPPVQPAIVTQPNSVRRVLFWSGVGLAGAGVIAGTITGVLSLSATSEAKGHCVGNQCPPETWSEIDRGRAMATVSTVSFVVAGVGAAAACVSYAFPATVNVGRSAAQARPVQIEGWIGAGSAGVRGRF
jgi:hypothetical protein